MKKILLWLLVKEYLEVLHFVIGKEIFFGDDRFEDAILFKKNKHNNKTE